MLRITGTFISFMIRDLSYFKLLSIYFVFDLLVTGVFCNKIASIYDPCRERVVSADGPSYRRNRIEVRIFS